MGDATRVGAVVGADGVAESAPVDEASEAECVPADRVLPLDETGFDDAQWMALRAGAACG